MSAEFENTSENRRSALNTSTPTVNAPQKSSASWPSAERRCSVPAGVSVSLMTPLSRLATRHTSTGSPDSSSIGLHRSARSRSAQIAQIGDRRLRILDAAFPGDPCEEQKKASRADEHPTWEGVREWTQMADGQDTGEHRANNEG